MLSRVACNIYWMSRYLERAEDTARLVSVHDNLLLDLPRRTATSGWGSLLAITGSEQSFAEHYCSTSETNVVRFLIADGDNPASIISSLRLARENLRTTRDIIPREAWEELNDLYLTIAEHNGEALSRRARHDYLKRIVRGSQLVSGLLAGTMSHGTAYHFLCLGGYLERADMTSRIVDVRSASLLGRQDQEAPLSPHDNIQWMSVLKSLTAYQMYRQQVRLRVQGPDVLDYLLRDHQFPRAIGFCLRQLNRSLHQLPHNSVPLAQVDRLHQRVEVADVRTLAVAGLHEFIDRLQIALGAVHDSIDKTYFNPPVGRQRQA